MGARMGTGMTDGGSCNCLGDMKLTWNEVEGVEIRRNWLKSLPFKAVCPNFVGASVLCPIYKSDSLAKYSLSGLMQNDRLLKPKVDTAMIKCDAFIIQRRKLSLERLEVSLRVSWLTSGRRQDLNLLCHILASGFFPSPPPLVVL